MDFDDVMKQRRSVRAFSGKPVEPGKILKILEAANEAPSAGNLQAYEIHHVTNRDCLEKLARAAFGQNFLMQAPAALVFSAHPSRASGKYGRRGASLYCVQDATIACTCAMLEATALDLATVWVGAFDDEAVRKAIGVGQELLPVAVLPIGYAAENPGSPGRRRLEDLVHPID
jgi:nitroreductase